MKGGAKLIVDNVFATPMLQKPLKLGADIVVYSATKHIDGQGRCMGGVILSDNAFVEDHLKNFLRQTGPSLSPFNAWVLLKGLETLPLAHRAAGVERRGHRRIPGQARPDIEAVLYPGLPRQSSAGAVRKADALRRAAGRVPASRRQGARRSGS